MGQGVSCDQICGRAGGPAEEASLEDEVQGRNLKLAQACVAAMGTENEDNVEAFSFWLDAYLDAGADVNARYHKNELIASDKEWDDVGQGYTLLMYAGSKNVRAAECCKLLLDRGADMFLRRPQGSSVMEMALVAATSKAAKGDAHRMRLIEVLENHLPKSDDCQLWLEEAWVRHLTLGMIHIFNNGGNLAQRRNVYQRMLENGFEPDNKRFVYELEMIENRFAPLTAVPFSEFAARGRIPRYDDHATVAVGDTTFVVFVSMLPQPDDMEPNSPRFRTLCDVCEQVKERFAHLFPGAGGEEELVRGQGLHLWIYESCVPHDQAKAKRAASNSLCFFINSSNVMLQMEDGQGDYSGNAWVRVHQRFAHHAHLPRIRVLGHAEMDVPSVEEVPPSEVPADPREGTLPTPEEMLHIPYQCFLAGKFQPCE